MSPDHDLDMLLPSVSVIGILALGLSMQGASISVIGWSLLIDERRGWQS